jgi:hypothetical protein
MTQGTEVNLNAITQSHAESEIPGGAVLLEFGHALVEGEAHALAEARVKLEAAMGTEVVVDAAGVVSNFERMVRIADGTGIPLGESLAARSEPVREELDLERFRRGIAK